MLGVLSIIAPVFGLVGVGFILAKLKILDPRADVTLSDFVFVLAVPALLFRTLSQGELGDTDPWPYWLSYFGAVAVSWSIGMALAAYVFKRAGREVAIWGFAAAQSNVVLLGIPLLLRVFGDSAEVPMFLLLAVHLPIMMTTATVLIEANGAGRMRDAFLRLVKALSTHPILIGIFCGLMVRLTGLVLPEPLTDMIDFLAAAASPVALVAVGLSLVRYGVGGSLGAALALSAAKIIIHPLAVYLIATHVFALDPLMTAAAVLFAALPAGVNVSLLANRYRTGEAVASSVVALSTMLSVVTISVWLLILGLA